jgi:hypothetical protein
MIQMLSNRKREYLPEAEVAKLVEAGKGNRYDDPHHISARAAGQ